MEHLSKNTYNEKLLLTLKEISNNTQKEVKNTMDSYIEKIISIGVAIFSSITSGIIVNLIGNGKLPIGVLILIYIIIIIVVFCLSSTLLKPILKKHRDSIARSSEDNFDLIFNTEILQKIAEINESVSVASETTLNECKILSIVSSIYNLNDVMNQLERNIIDKNTRTIKIRTKSRHPVTQVCNVRVNLYALSAISYTLTSVNNKLKNMMDEKIVKELTGYNLLAHDYKYISKEINEFQNFIDNCQETSSD